MGHEAIAQISELLGNVEELRKTLSNGERLQLVGLTEAFLGELERPDEAVFRMVSRLYRKGSSTNGSEWAYLVRHCLHLTAGHRRR